jgi:hypothetical protein
VDNSVEVQGRADSGRVKILHQDNAMTIYLRHKDADKGIYPLDLRESLSVLCSLSHLSQVRLLEFILNEPDADEIRGELSRRGFPQLTTEIMRILETEPLVKDSDVILTGQETHDSTLLPTKDGFRFYGHTPNTRRYRRPRADYDNDGSVKAFLSKFNIANAFGEQLTQPWDEAGAENLLAHACRLDDVDPWNLLPRNRNQWDELLKAKGKPPGVATGTFWSANRHVQGKGYLGDRRNVRNSYPAVVIQDNRRNMVIKISNAVENRVTDDTLFAAEHHVCIPLLWSFFPLILQVVTGIQTVRKTSRPCV